MLLGNERFKTKCNILKKRLLERTIKGEEIRMNQSNVRGHIAAIVTILIWGTAFITTKTLLRDFEPIEILSYRFTIGFIVLLLIHPHRLKGTSLKQEILFAMAGLSGLTLYFLLENIALTYTSASNVGVIISAAPFFTAILSYIFLKTEKLKPIFFLGFLFAIIGILLISFNGITMLDLNPVGDFLAILASVLWAVYSILTRKISEFGYNTIQTTRRIFLYGIIFLIPAMFIFSFDFGIERFSSPSNLASILFLGVGASAMCFVTWNFAVKILGAIKTSIYIYMVPVITVVTSMIILDEIVTPMSLCGIALTLIGLVLSERASKSKKD